jgi:TetR/AcrR family transcriptional regulator
MAAHSGGTDREVNEAEAKLLDSALRLFAEKGYEGTSIREIIEGAGVTRPVLYYYFENKEDLYRRIVETRFSEYLSKLSELKNEYAESVGRLKAVMRETFRFAEACPDALRLILQVFFSPPQCGPSFRESRLGPRRFRVIEEIMKDAVDKAELAGGDAQSLALIFLGIMDMYIMAKSDRPAMHLTDDLAEGLVDLFFYGACYKENPITWLISPYSSMG